MTAAPSPSPSRAQAPRRVGARGIQRRLWLILGLAALGIIVASAMTLTVLLKNRAGLAEVVAREQSVASAALVLAQTAERLAERAPALLAAPDAAAQRQQTDLIDRDLRALVSATERLRVLHRDATGDRLVWHTLLFVAVGLAAVLLATLLADGLVVRDISRNLRAVTSAMQQVANGERGARVPAMDRDDEIGELARVFNVFKEQAFRMETLDRQLTEKSNLLLATFDNMNDGFTVFDDSARLMAWNPQFRRLYALADGDIVLGVPLTAIHRLLAGRGARAYTTLGEEVPLGALSLRRSALNQQFEIRCPDGHIIELRSNPIPNGGFVTIHIDVSERRAVEAQLHQAQKMELVGQLTGGIAHDFSNILAAILGNLAYLEPATSAAPALRERWHRAMAATDRATRQVERLLAFARRQHLAPEVVDLNALIVGLLDLLEVSLGAGVQLDTRLADRLPPVRVDPGQLENALMNLVINARDGIGGDGGRGDGIAPDGIRGDGIRGDRAACGGMGQQRITITTAPVGAGAVEVIVGDTGRGIPAAILARVCEPFFTTKSAGKGSGLGLSMVYGFARQSGGALRIDSSPGQGTRVHLCLPVAEPVSPAVVVPAVAVPVVGPVAGSAREADAMLNATPAHGPSVGRDDQAGRADSASALPLGQGEWVLAVDDDPDLLASTAAELRALGYRVLTAGDGASALARLAEAPAIRLLYTDLVMPQPWDGVSLARAARAQRPDLALLYTSGATRAVGQPAATLLRKPVDRAALARALRQALEA